MLASIGHFLASHAIALFMLSVGLRTGHVILREMVTTRRTMTLRALAAVWIGVPLLTLALLYVLRPGPLDAATLMVMAICPGVPLLLRKSDKAHGDRDTALIVLIAALLTAVVLTPAWAALLRQFTPLHLVVAPRDELAVVLPKVLLPFALGRIVHHLAPRLAAPLAKVANALFLVGVAAILIAVIVKRPISLSDLSGRGAIAAFLIALGSALLGYMSTRGPIGERSAIAFAGAFGNPMLALTILAQSYSFEAFSLIGIYIVIRTLAFVPFSLWLNHERKHHQGLTYA